MPKRLFICMLPLLLAFAASARASVLSDYLDSLKSQAQQPFSAERGQQFWVAKHPAPDGGKDRACALCHTADLTQYGKHVRTGKVIKPMATVTNPDRLTDRRKIRKWLLRNCKWVLGRTCTAQEKGDVLTFMNQYGR